MIKFMPNLEVGGHGKASKTLVNDALGKLSAKKLDVVVSLFDRIASTLPRAD